MIIAQGFTYVSLCGTIAVVRVGLGANIWHEEGAEIAFHVARLALGTPTLRPQPIKLDGVALEPVLSADYPVPVVDLRRPGYGDLAGEVADMVRRSVAQRALIARGLTGDMWVRNQPQDDGSRRLSVIAGMQVDGFATLQTQLSNRFHWVRPLHFAYATVLEAKKAADDVPEFWRRVSQAVGSLGLYRSDLFAQVFPLQPQEASRQSFAD